MRAARLAIAVVVAVLTPAWLSAQPTKRICALVVDRARSPVIAAPTALPDKMKALATPITSQHRQAASQYAVEYTSDAKNVKGVELEVTRPNVGVSLSQRRMVN